MALCCSPRGGSLEIAMQYVELQQIKGLHARKGTHSGISACHAVLKCKNIVIIKKSAPDLAERCFLPFPVKITAQREKSAKQTAVCSKQDRIYRDKFKV